MKNCLLITMLCASLCASAVTTDGKKQHMVWEMNQQLLANSDTTLTSAVNTPSAPKRDILPVRILKWFGKNWSDYDPRYSVTSFYDWAVQLQNTTSREYLNTIMPEGMDIEMYSDFSNKFGPYFGWRWVFLGTTIDLSTIGKPKKRKNEFTLKINSNLMNIELIRRRTGGDFNIGSLLFVKQDGSKSDYTMFANRYDLGDYISNSLTGVNINYFTNHRKYSNPAAFSNGAIQLRSVGSPIIGLGYTHQKVESDISWLFTEIAALEMVDEDGFHILTDEEVDMLDEMYDESGTSLYYETVYKILDDNWGLLRKMPTTRVFLTNRIPTTTRISDWHLQLGYAYNLVFSRRLLLGASLILSPSLKYVKADNIGSMTYEMADQFAQLIEKHEVNPATGQPYQVSPDYFHLNYSDTHLTANLFGRLSLTYNYNRWRAGFMATYSNYFYEHKGMTVDNAFGDLTVYLGYCFGRKKEFRHDGENRQMYIQAALTSSQIEELRDTMPAGNVIPLAQSSSMAREAETIKPTRRYHNDHLRIDIVGCDLVKGPDGRYGTFEIQDGYVTPGQDTEGRLRAGTVLDIDENGTMTVQAGHRASFRAGNWWKSKLEMDQTANHWYPEMLHYALKGKLTLNLRGRIFGTLKPVQLVIDSVCVNHGKEAKSFWQLGVQSFRSESAFSIQGYSTINNRPCRIYFEQHDRGKRTILYVSRIYPSLSQWMSKIPDNKPISRISMPGTHDSGSASVVETAITKTAHTQNFSVAEQLRDGIRAFDLRLKNDMHYGHTFRCRDSFDKTMERWEDFLTEHPSEFIVAMMGSDEGGKWSNEMKANYMAIIKRYPHRFVEKFRNDTPLGDVRGKIIVIKRQEDCPFGRLLKFQDNAVFQYDGFCVEDVYKQFKSWKKIRLVEENLRASFEDEDPTHWYVTFNSISWSPRRHAPYSYAWGGNARNIRKPTNKTLNEIINMKGYTELGMIFLDFYNDHGEQPQLVENIINSNFSLEDM